jgi:hypothetical protein
MMVGGSYFKERGPWDCVEDKLRETLWDGTTLEQQQVPGGLVGLTTIF